MNNTNLATLARLLGALFYYSPSSDVMPALLTALQEIDQLEGWQNPALIEQQCQIIQSESRHAYDLVYQHSLLFEGQGSMQAPPWGSVYLDNDGLLMGISTENYRAFLAEHGIHLNTGINEPEDQFGLMLMALALLIEKEKKNAAKQLIQQHLLTWAPRYLEQLLQNQISRFYQALAVIAQQYIQILENVQKTRKS